MTEMTLSRRQPSIWWGAMIICGTVVGAGMFTLPVVMAGAWFGWAMVLLLISWGGMLLSGLLFMRVSLKYPPGAGYDTLTKDLLGRGWAALNGLSILFVLGILTYAYISASGPVYQHSISQLGLPISTAEAKILLTLCVALVVWLGTTGVSRLMTFCVLAKILLLFVLFGGLLTQVNVPSLLSAPAAGEQYWPYALGVLPFCLASFGYHGNITGLVSYYEGNKQNITRALVLGTLLSLALYLFWLTSTMGNLPRDAFPEIVKQGGDIAALMSALRDHLHVNALALMMSIFSHFAVIASFLGVTAGLFDFIADRLGLGNSPGARLKTASLTFLPPLLASICWPNGFVAAIGFAGLFATLWAVIIPAMLACKSQQRCSVAVGLLFVFGAMNILAWLLSWFGVLPEFGG
ncbi:aromatic amino acid transporter [Pantoea sp. S18]|uniref:aromatic amino acid transporter n=1 Tax=Pantoea sp. S18 TaxID=3019892 RepID=UPI002B1F7590|nr:aromatic amino acid transporter [Pantoea sp. S18]MEA5101173.1 aromatic amino acid transporter [Pantoea sp. S18]